MRNDLFDDFPEDPLAQEEYDFPKGKKTYAPVQCYKTHPALKIGEHTIYGGSASNPVVHDADIYVSLQYGSTSGRVSDPWDKKEVREIQFEITDAKAPTKSHKRFGKMVEYLVEQLKEGKKIHVGCIGGHGRTGMLLAAIYAKLTGNKDAIQYVRKHYCKKAVESKEQVDFLVQQFGVTPVEQSKDFGLFERVGSGFGYTPRKKTVGKFGGPSSTSLYPASTFSTGPSELLHVGGQMAPAHVIPMEYSFKSIWKARVDKLNK